MDLATGGDLMEALGAHPHGFQEEQAKQLILDVARGASSGSVSMVHKPDSRRI